MALKSIDSVLYGRRLMTMLIIEDLSGVTAILTALVGTVCTKFALNMPRLPYAIVS